MTLGSRAVTRPNYSGHNEAILYRNHTEILTDQRLFLNGKMYTFDQIDRVDVVRLKLYFPFQIMRGIALIVTLICVGLIAMNIMGDFLIVNTLVYGVVAVLAMLFVFVSTATVPTHAVRLTIGGKHVFMMHENNKAYLERVRAAVQQGMNRH